MDRNTERMQALEPVQSTGTHSSARHAASSYQATDIYHELPCWAKVWHVEATATNCCCAGLTLQSCLLLLAHRTFLEKVAAARGRAGPFPRGAVGTGLCPRTAKEKDPCSHTAEGMGPCHQDGAVTGPSLDTGVGRVPCLPCSQDGVATVPSLHTGVGRDLCPQAGQQANPFLRIEVGMDLCPLCPQDDVGMNPCQPPPHDRHQTPPSLLPCPPFLPPSPAQPLPSFPPPPLHHRRRPRRRRCCPPFCPCHHRCRCHCPACRPCLRPCPLPHHPAGNCHRGGPACPPH